MDYLFSSDGYSAPNISKKYKAADAPSSRQEIITNALQRIATDPNLGGSTLGGIGQGLAGFAYGSMASRQGDELAKQQDQKRQAFASVFDKLSQGNPNAAIAGIGEAAKLGLSPEEISKVFGDALKSATQIQTSRDASGNPYFTNTSSAISNRLVDAPQQNTEFKTKSDVLNDQIMRQQAQQNIGLRGQELDLSRNRLNAEQNQLAKPPSGYVYQPDGTLKYISGGPADPNVKASAKPLPSNASKQLSENNSAMNAIDNALNIASGSPSAFGLLGGLAGSSSLTNNQADPNNVMARAAVADIGSKVIHDRSGAAVTISEEPRLKPFVPTAYDSPKVIEQKLNQLKRKLAEENEGLLNTYEAQGYNISNKLRDISTPASTSTSQPSKGNSSGKTFSDIPSASQYTGKRIKGPNGEILRSNGTSWERIQ